MLGTLFKKGAEARKKLEEEGRPEKTVYETVREEGYRESYEAHKKAVEEARKRFKAAGFTPTPLGSAPPGGHSSLFPSSVTVGPRTTSVNLVDKVCRFCLDNDLWIKRTGSQLVDGIEPNDYDFVVEDTEGIMMKWLVKNGYYMGGSEHPESEFTSWKNGSVNIIVCNSRPFFKKYLMATELLKQLQPKTKQERIDIFDTVMGRNEDKYGVAF